jgi:hypothetical protein
MLATGVNSGSLKYSQRHIEIAFHFRSKAISKDELTLILNVLGRVLTALTPSVIYIFLGL